MKQRLQLSASDTASPPPLRQQWQRQVSKFLPLVLAIGVFALSMGMIRQELEQHSLNDIWQSISAIPPVFLGGAIALVCMNYWVMTGYDTLAIRYIQHPLPYRQTALAATLTYAISNAIGATFLSGGALKYRFYNAWGLRPFKIAQIIAFCNLSFWLGLLSMGGVLFLTETITIPDTIRLPFHSLQSVGLLALVTVATYLVFSGVIRRSIRIGSLQIPRLPLPIAIAQIGLTCCDWALAAATLYVLLAPDSFYAFPSFIGVYVFAKWAGVMSSVPGGLGVFETVIILMMTPAISSVELLGALLVFRMIHNVVPMMVAMVALGIYEVRQFSK